MFQVNRRQCRDNHRRYRSVVNPAVSSGNCDDVHQDRVRPPSAHSSLTVLFAFIFFWRCVSLGTGFVPRRCVGQDDRRSGDVLHGHRLCFADVRCGVSASLGIIASLPRMPAKWRWGLHGGDTSTALPMAASVSWTTPFVVAVAKVVLPTVTVVTAVMTQRQCGSRWSCCGTFRMTAVWRLIQSPSHSWAHAGPSLDIESQCRYYHRIPFSSGTTQVHDEVPRTTPSRLPEKDVPLFANRSPWITRLRCNRGRDRRCHPGDVAPSDSVELSWRQLRHRRVSSFWARWLLLFAKTEVPQGWRAVCRDGERRLCCLTLLCSLATAVEASLFVSVLCGAQVLKGRQPSTIIFEEPRRRWTHAEYERVVLRIRLRAPHWSWQKCGPWRHVWKRGEALGGGVSLSLTRHV